jgi:hypothetical protein
MKARIPAGIDLEDRLLYGLSPARLGEVVALAVIASWCWRQPVWAPLRVLAAVVLLAAAGAAGWWRWEGRHLDSWAIDAGRHAWARYRIEVDRARLANLALRLRAFARRVVRWAPP